MPKIQLAILGGRPITPEVQKDAETLMKVSDGKLKDFFMWLEKSITENIALSDDEYTEVAKRFGLQGTAEFVSAARLANNLFKTGANLSHSEVVSDLEKLGFEQKKIETIMSCLEFLWTEFEVSLKRRRKKAIPSLQNIRWRVDIRQASSDFLKNPEVVAILRIGTHDGDTEDEFYLEIDRDEFSYLERQIGKIKEKILEAEESLGQRV